MMLKTLPYLLYSSVWLSILHLPVVYNNNIVSADDLMELNVQKRDFSYPPEAVQEINQSQLPIQVITVPPEVTKQVETDQGDKMDTREFVSPEVAKNEILHIPIASRVEDQNCECGFKYAVEVMKTNEFGEQTPGVENDQPWQVWITYIITSKGKTRYEVKCGGSLINDKLILTSAPCVEAFQRNPEVAEFLWEKRRVNVRLDGKGRRAVNAIKIAEVIMHPQYLTGQQEFQVALLRLASPLDFKVPQGVRPVCLPGLYEHLQLGRDGVLPKLKYDDISAKSIEEKVPQSEDYNSLYSTYDCQRIYEQLDNTVAKMHICGGIRSNYTGKYFGNPLMAEMANTQLLQVGMLSSLYFYEKKIVNTTVNLFIRIMDLLPFIDEVSVMSGATWCKHAVMKFNDSAPLSRIVGEAWLGTKSSSRVENPACVCGYRTSKLQQGRIVGGSEAIPYDYPWQVLLEISMDDQPLQSAECGASIINDKFILTAAHCIFDQYKAVNPETATVIPVTDTANVKLRILAHNTEHDEKAKIMEVKKIHIHPEYVEDFKLGYQDYDVALLELKEPLDFWHPNGPLPVCILQSSDNLDLVGRMGTVIGWGMTEIDDANSGASALQQINVPVQPLHKCKILSSLEVTDRFICAGTFDPTHDTLHGDSGGPLMVETLQNRMLQIGVVSWGDLERRKTEGLFTDISAALYTNVSKPEILSYIDYFSKKADARWCKKAFFGPNPRRPWEGQRNIQKTINPDCVCGMPDESEPNEKNPTSEFPWTVLVIKLDRPGTVSYCMGTIINSLFILTSAQCLRNSDKVQLHLRPTIRHKEVRIQLIRYETETVNLRSALRVADVHIHPDFLALEGENRFEKNIGLIKLETPLVFTKRRKLGPICLPSEWETSTFVGADAMVTGWKRTSTGKTKQVTLEVLDEKIVETDTCGKLQRLGVTQNYICTASKKPEDPVKITDGGSVTVDLANKQLIQVGVMSHFGLRSSNGKRRYASVKDSLAFIEYFSEEANAIFCKRK